MRFVFPRGRNLGFATCMAVVQIVFAVLMVAGFYYFWPAAGPYAAGLIGFSLLMAIIDLVLFRSEVEVTPRGVSIASGKFSVGAPREIDVLEIKKFTVKWSGSAGNVSAADLFVELTNGKTEILAKRIIPPRIADEIARRLEQGLARSVSPP